MGCDLTPTCHAAKRLHNEPHACEETCTSHYLLHSYYYHLTIAPLALSLLSVNPMFGHSANPLNGKGSGSEATEGNGNQINMNYTLTCYDDTRY